MRTYKSTKEYAANIRQHLKAEIPDYKFSVRCEHYSSIVVSIVSGPRPLLKDGTYRQLNRYCLASDSQLTREGLRVARKATEIALREHWDDSDIRVDYFSCAFYLNVHVGKWDAPYEVKSKAKGAK
jgi:hypothetical protein